AKQYKIPIFKTIREALTLGGNDLAVDAVLSIGEHGDYPTNKLRQVEYPRKRFFDEIVAVMQRSNRFVPLFNAKPLSYPWDWSRPLAEAALAAELGKNVPDIRRPLPREKDAPPHAILLTYRDGMRATILKLGRSSVRWNFACKVSGERAPRATSFNAGPWGNR